MSKLSRSHHALAILITLSTLTAVPAHAINWVMLQGTEPAKAPAVRAFGFIAIDAQGTNGHALPAGPWQGQALAMNQLPPRLNEHQDLRISHARLGVRGRLLDGNINYWISPMAGENPISSNGTPNLKLTDISLTLNWIPHARLRLGQFFSPGSEEGITQVLLRHYINPSMVGSQIVNELPFETDGTPRDQANRPSGPASGWRQSGLQLFDAFRTGDWEHTYALMASTGSGLAIYNGLGTGRPDWHLYWSSELVFGGSGLGREGWKLFGWSQSGERELRVGQTQTARTFTRNRYGLGSTFERGSWRAGAEWIGADGMIPNGTDGSAVPGAVSNDGRWIASYNVLPEARAEGWYLDVGYRLLEQLELRARYDRLDRGVDRVLDERRFETVTLGLTYRFNPHLKILADYQFRSIEAPLLADTAVPNQILDAVDDLVAVRLFASF